MIRFRTQDTRASTRRKLNELFGFAEGDLERFHAPTPTLIEWATKLNLIGKMLVDEDYPLSAAPEFRVSDTRQMWARKLNILAAAFEAGPEG